MEERRKHPRLKRDSVIRIRTPIGIEPVVRWEGVVTNMSEGGVFVAQVPLQYFCPEMAVEAEILGEGWDHRMPTLGMKVIRVGQSGIALVYEEAEVPLWDTTYLPDSVNPSW